MRRVVQAILGHPALYILSQRALLADRPRYRCIDELDVKAGHRVLDVGCGPAYYLKSLPRGIDYHGFDTDERYIDWARAHFGDRGTFHLGLYTDVERQKLPQFDRVLLMGLLHHLDDAQTHELLDLLVRSLAPGGVVVTLDTCFDARLHPLQTMMARQDRGEHVRDTARFKALAAEHFAVVEGELLDPLTPVRLFMMKLAQPIARRESQAA